jgi:ATP/maltotriose-dependent transcriptional regulator MalT
LDVLHQHLERMMPEQIHDLHIRASEWFEQRGFIPEAIHHTLMARDPERAVRLVEENGCQLLMAGEVVTLERWLEAVAPFAPAHPWFAILKGWVLTLTGQQDQVGQVLDRAPALCSRSPLDPLPMSNYEGGSGRRPCLRQCSARSTAGCGRRCNFPEGDALGVLRSLAT